MLEVLLAFIDHVLPAGRFLLAGTSLGGYLARAIAAQRRPRVAGLLLRVPAVVTDTARRSLPSFRPLVHDDALMAALGKEERTILGDVLVQTRAYIGTLGRRLRGIVQPAIDRTAPLMVDIRADPGRYAVSFDLADREKGFEEPTLIIAGRQDTVVGYREAWTILESYPRATFAVIDRADHGWPLESHDLLGALIDDWLMRIAERDV